MRPYNIRVAHKPITIFRNIISVLLSESRVQLDYVEIYKGKINPERFLKPKTWWKNMKSIIAQHEQDS